MSDVDQVQVAADDETPVNPYSLLEAVNRSSDTAHTAWLIFLAIMVYLMVAIAGVTHRDLLLETPVSLPILQVEIQQAQFFQFAPVILLLFHLGLVSQLVLLARKTLEFDNAVRRLESSSRRAHPLRLEVHNFFFVQAIAGPHRSVIMSAFLHGMSWLTLVILPVILLLYIQISFLPYHNVVVTWTHRICLLLDIMVLMLLGIFLMRMETSFWAALFRTTIHHPLALLVTIAVMGSTAFFSLFVATVPGERLDQIVSALFQSKNAKTAGQGRYDVGFTLPFLASSKDGSLFGIFHRNLIVQDTDLVRDKTVTGKEATLILRGRDLRNAKLDRSDLHGADLTGANLDGASLVGTDLRWVKLQCADVSQLFVTDNREAANCPTAKGADFSRARLNDARLAGGDFSNAKFEDANLTNAEFKVALLSGANFSSAVLDKADFSGGTKMQGANFLLASMRGADLTGAQMQFADLSSAQMQGATLNYAHLQGGVLRGTNLNGAALIRAKLQGADLRGAAFKAADLRGISIWLTAPPSIRDLAVADASVLNIEVLKPATAKALRKRLSSIATPSVRIRVRDRLAPILNINRSRSWRSKPDHQRWQNILAVSRAEVGPSYPNKLTEYLANLMCKARWRRGAVATGILRRAQASSFKGRLGPIHDRLMGNNCPGSKGAPVDLVNEITARVDLERENRPQQPNRPQPTLASPDGGGNPIPSQR